MKQKITMHKANQNKTITKINIKNFNWRSNVI